MLMDADLFIFFHWCSLSSYMGGNLIIGFYHYITTASTLALSDVTIPRIRECETSAFQSQLSPYYLLFG